MKNASNPRILENVPKFDIGLTNWANSSNLSLLFDQYISLEKIYFTFKFRKIRSGKFKNLGDVILTPLSKTRGPTSN